VINGAKRRYSAALSEYESRFLNVANRSVNRKVQGSNPCSGAKLCVQNRVCSLAVVTMYESELW